MPIMKRVCKNCKVEFEAWQSRKYCSECQPKMLKQWRHKTYLNKKAKTPLKIPACIICGKKFTDNKGGRRYCNQCRVERNNGVNLSNLHKCREKQLDRDDCLRRIKQKLGCQRCGSTDIRVLQFHHIYPEDKEITITGKYSKKRLLWEILKCEVLCANCHIIAHIEMENRHGWHKPKRNLSN